MHQNRHLQNLKLKIQHHTSVRPSSSMAEENKVKNFNLFHPKQNGETSISTNQPQRIELPIFFNTPIRNNNIQVVYTRKIRNANQSLHQYEEPLQFPGIDNSKSPNQGQTEGVTMPKYQQKLQRVTEIQTFLSSNRRLKDYELLAFACRRAGKQRDEGRAYFSMGILQDNLGEWKKAINSYQKFLVVCKTIGDVHGEGLAYNCIGVNYLLLSDENPNYIDDAINYHKKHEEVSDINGKFLASINLGLSYDKLDDQRLSLFYYQNALKYAMKMSNILGQSIAIGNIAKIGTKGLNDNTEKMKIFVEKYIKLAQELSDNQGQIKGHVKLGILSANRGIYHILKKKFYKGDYMEGKQNFMKALEMTNQIYDSQVYQNAKCGYAVSNAECSMDNYLLQYASQIHYK